MRSRSVRVLPTRVGMVRREYIVRRVYCCSPHPRGDGPVMLDCDDGSVSGSPHPRGDGPIATLPRCDSSRRSPHPRGDGPVRRSQSARSRSSPHPRGDGPDSQRDQLIRWPFSPPAWGWSASSTIRSTGSCVVLPTRVGMVRTGMVHSAYSASFSPPAWGWSVDGHLCVNACLVLPTRVGMVRNRLWRCSWSGSPHTRGDGPNTYSY